MGGKEGVMKNTAKIKMLVSMCVFGTVGIFVRYIPMSSAAIAFCRGALGCVFLLAFIVITGRKLSGGDIKKHLPVLCLSGAAIGGNWILLFEAYRYTTVATATICYYLAPVFLLIATAFMGERMTAKKLICIGVALVGMVFVSGVLKGGLPGKDELMGIACGVGAAVLYATVMVLNRKLCDMGAYDKTAVQLGIAAIVVLPYYLLTGGDSVSILTVNSGTLLLLVVGILHTGIAYTMYFGAMGELKAHTVAVFSYLDPVVAVLLSALLLKEPLDGYGIVGAVLILGSALYSEIPERKR